MSKIQPGVRGLARLFEIEVYRCACCPSPLISPRRGRCSGLLRHQETRVISPIPKAFPIRSLFFSTVSTRWPRRKGTMIAFVSKGSGEYLKDKGIFSDIESSIKLNEATKEDTINIGDEDRGWDTRLLAKLLLIFMQIYGFEGGEGRSRRKVLEGERSGRIVRRGARSLLNLPNTASPIPRLPFLLSSSREKLGGFVLRRKTSSFQPARMSFTTCLRAVHIPRPFCGSSTICDVTRHNFDRWFFPFSPRINPFPPLFKSFATVITFEIIVRKRMNKRRTLVYFFRKFSNTKSVPYYVEWNITEPLWGFSLLRIFPIVAQNYRIDRKGLSRV